MTVTYKTKKTRSSRAADFEEFTEKSISRLRTGRIILRRAKIVSALNNPKYKSRTIGGISEETHLSRSTIVRALKSDKTLITTVKVNPIRAKDGRILVTTKDRFLKNASFKERFIDFFASKRVEIEDAE